MSSRWKPKVDVNTIMLTFAQFVSEELMYHGTPRKNMKSILKYGLMPSIGINKLNGEDDDRSEDERNDSAVHLTKHYPTARWYAAGGFGKKSNKGAVFTVDTDHPSLKNHKFDHDPHEHQSVIVRKPIPPEALTVEPTTHERWLL